ncbi:hypothetical protein J2I47_04405 [Fibrella sp. HMF5335]|uniref:Uncharacterized protein n=1 Tax=Fibrella rubiginis TaxID=2817060 RepID=A0A939K3M7_9BACT|nr:hypothetical protein [Fibrella rubiginis]MBO0935783.1 hypothetical protein [Fibrella rubiginis]
MESRKEQLGFDSVALAKAFAIQRFEANEPGELMTRWLQAQYELTAEETKLLHDLHAKAQVEGDYWNEEELKINLIGFLFYLSRIEEPKRIKVFYERRMSAKINGYSLAVICDCMVATPLFNAPGYPYFFLQEYKKSRGDKVDPEAQVLTAMLIAQAQNDDTKPVYGSYVLGTNLYFTVLHGQQYYHSRKYDLLRLEDLTQFVFSIRKLKEFITE